MVIFYSLQRFFSFRFPSSHFSEKEIKKGDRSSNVGPFPCARGMDDTVGIKTPECPCFQDTKLDFFSFFFFFSSSGYVRLDAQDGLVECRKIERGETEN